MKRKGKSGEKRDDEQERPCRTSFKVALKKGLTLKEKREGSGRWVEEKTDKADIICYFSP